MKKPTKKDLAPKATCKHCRQPIFWRVKDDPGQGGRVEMWQHVDGNRRQCDFIAEPVDESSFDGQQVNISRRLLEALAAGRPDGRYHNGWFLCGFCKTEQEDKHDYDCAYVELRMLLEA